MAFMDSFKDFFGAGSSYDDYGDDPYDDYDDDDFVDDYEEEKPVKPTSRFEKKAAVPKQTSRFSRDYDDDDDDDDIEAAPARTTSRFARRTSSRQSKVVEMSTSRKSYKAEIITYKPTSIEDSKDIVSSLLAGQAILLNFEGVHNELAQRIIDSMIGACCAVDGTLKKVSSYIWIVAPSSIGLEGEYSDTTSPSSYDYRGRYQY